MSVLIPAILAADPLFDLRGFLLGRFKDEGNDLSEAGPGFQIHVSLVDYSDHLEAVKGNA